MDLYIIRHAWAEPGGSPAWPSDAQRPLTDEGRERWARMAEILVSRGMTPPVIATSPLVRCLETAQILAAAIGRSAAVVAREELRPHGDPAGLLGWTRKQQDRHEQIAWVGHAPDVDYLAAALIGQGGATIHFGKAAVAAIRLDGPIGAAAGELRWLATAKMLGC